MVHLQKSLLFPNLNFQSEAQFKPWGSENYPTGSGTNTSIYKLDWGAIDCIKADQWAKHHCKTSSSKFPGTLPQKYNDWVKDMLFALPNNYLREIRRTARLAQTEWGSDRNFDTMVRDICLQPAVEYSYVAFRLLADCLYDATTNYFYRGPEKVIATQALLYKFWAFQTGQTMIQKHARFDKLECQINEAALESALDTHNTTGTINQFHNKYQIKEFLKAINEYEKSLEMMNTVKELPKWRETLSTDNSKEEVTSNAFQMTRDLLEAAGNSKEEVTSNAFQMARDLLEAKDHKDILTINHIFREKEEIKTWVPILPNGRRLNLEDVLKELTFDASRDKLKALKDQVLLSCQSGNRNIDCGNLRRK